MATSHDYYAILQVHPQAEPEVIDAAYRKLATKYHPDLNREADAGTRMKEINVAYEVLSDPDKRAAYDARCRAGPRAQARPRPSSPPRSGSSWRGYVLPIALALFVAVASRFGIHAALIFTTLLLLIALYLLSPPTGSKK